jgi:hypothetical protein
MLQAVVAFFEALLYVIGLTVKAWWPVVVYAALAGLLRAYVGDWTLLFTVGFAIWFVIEMDRGDRRRGRW